MIWRWGSTSYPECELIAFDSTLIGVWGNAPKKLCFEGQIRRSRTRRVRKHPRERRGFSRKERKGRKDDFWSWGAAQFTCRSLRRQDPECELIDLRGSMLRSIRRNVSEAPLRTFGVSYKARGHSRKTQAGKSRQERRFRAKFNNQPDRRGTVPA